MYNHLVKIGVSLCMLLSNDEWFEFRVEVTSDEECHMFNNPDHFAGSHVVLRCMRLLLGWYVIFWLVARQPNKLTVI